MAETKKDPWTPSRLQVRGECLLRPEKEDEMEGFTGNSVKAKLGGLLSGIVLDVIILSRMSP